jgi:hypothetical protein
MWEKSSQFLIISSKFLHTVLLERLQQQFFRTLQEVTKMKKRTLVVLGLVLSMSIIVAGSALARQGGGYGMMGGGFERGAGDCYRADVDPETMAKFQKETLSLRDEMITKRLELSQEYDKDTPDADRIAQLRKDMIDVQTKIQKVADKYDIDAAGQGRRARAGNGRGNANCGGGCNY